MDRCVPSRYSDAVSEPPRTDDIRPSSEHGDARVLELVAALHDRVAQPLAAASLALSLAELGDEDRIRAGAAVAVALAQLRAVLVAATDELESDPTAGARVSAPAADGSESALAAATAREATVQRLETVVRSVVAEALANAGKHGNPSEIMIAVHGEADGIVSLELLSESVRDASNGHRGVGLRLAALAARSVGATLEVGPADGGHWRVRMCVGS
jgi:signal transduction histidine kinase